MVAVKKSAPDRAVEAIKSDCAELLSLLGQQKSGIPLKDLRRYEALAFEKCREMILAGADPVSASNPYGEAENGPEN